jgi:starch synthase
MKNITSLFGFNKKRMKILFVSSEEAPFAKVGGLGEVMFSLPRSLSRLGHDARVIMPLYGTIDQKKFSLPYVCRNVSIPVAAKDDEHSIICNVRRFAPKGLGDDPVATYFLENREYFELRSNVYGYADDRIRFLLLCSGCLKFLDKHSDWIPDVIVCADWMSGYLPNLLKTEYAGNKRFSGVASVFSIHNLAAQGIDKPERFISETQKDDGVGSLPDLLDPRLKEINPVRRGIINADVINTVSETYAKEIMTEEYGEGLNALLQERSDDLYGILNGIDYKTNDPATDHFVAKRYSIHDPLARLANKLALQKRLGLPQKKDAFVMGIVSRISRQKGFVLLQPVIETFLRVTGAQLVVVGTGDTELMDFFLGLQKALPEQVASYLQYHENLPHLVFAGSDVILIPSQYEPSGLTQMEAMRYGAVPVARKTGGLADTIEDYRPGEGRGTGFLFAEMDSHELLIALTRAFSGWRHRVEWRSLQKRVMEKDFSWDRSAKGYALLFKKAIAAHRAAK